jgi:V/A-type H+-transporting ATPase subunit E
MTIEKIIKKIEAETEEIMNQANKEVNALKFEAKKKLSEEMKSTRKEGEKRIAIMRNIDLSEARRAATKSILSAKEGLIKTCFDQAKERLGKLTGEEYRKVMDRLLKESLVLVGNKGVASLTREEDKAFFRAVPNMEVRSGLVPGLGGFIMESTDGKIVVDNTFNAILERNKEDIRTEVANILYPED